MKKLRLNSSMGHSSDPREEQKEYANKTVEFTELPPFSKYLYERVGDDASRYEILGVWIKYLNSVKGSTAMAFGKRSQAYTIVAELLEQHKAMTAKASGYEDTIF